MITIEETSFGKIKINGKIYKHDVYILPGGKIEKRQKHLSKKIYGHTCLGRKELEYILGSKPDVLIIGKGQMGVLPYSNETKKILAELKIPVIEGKTPEIISKLNEKLKSDEKVAAILHLTC